MDFNLTEDQRMLRDSVQRLLGDTYDFSQRSKHISEPEGWSRSQWRRFADMGLLGLSFPCEYGGFGGGPVETMIVMEAFGRSLVMEPYLPTVLLGGGFLQDCGSDAQRAAYLPRIADGTLLFAFAQAEQNSRYDLDYVETRAERADSGWIINGHKRQVLGGDCADWLIVTARIAGEVASPDGLALFLVSPSSPGVSKRGYRLQDHTRAADFTFSNVSVKTDAAIGAPGLALASMTRVINRAIAALCCEAVGVMASAHDRTMDYLKLRKQFGSPLGSFQALQHRAVDMFVQLELARSIAMYGITSCNAYDLAESSRAASATKIQIDQSSRTIGQESIQLHGGIGMSDELPVGHYFRRLTMMEKMFGDTQHHLCRLARQGGLIAPEAD